MEEGNVHSYVISLCIQMQKKEKKHMHVQRAAPGLKEFVRMCRCASLSEFGFKLLIEFYLWKQKNIRESH